MLNAIAGLSTANGPQTLDTISGQNYAGFGNAMVQGAQLFMSNFANRAGSGSTAGTRIALAEACDVACDATPPALWGAWGGAVGGTGTIAGNDNAGTFTYSVGGFSGGLDRRFGDNFLAGVAVGYQTGGQWTGGFGGRSVTDSFQAGLYGSFIPGSALRRWPRGLRLLGQPDVAANHHRRAAAAHGLWPGRRQPVFRPGRKRLALRSGRCAGILRDAFALLPGLDGEPERLHRDRRTVAQPQRGAADHQSLRTIFGAQLGAAMDIGLRDRLAGQLRLGWSHEYSDTAVR